MWWSQSGFMGIANHKMVLPSLCLFFSTDKTGLESSFRIWWYDTVFENNWKSLIQHCQRSELRLHFEWIKVNEKWLILAVFLSWRLRSNSVTRQVNLKRTKIDGKCQNSKATIWVIFKHRAFGSLEFPALFFKKSAGNLNHPNFKSLKDHFLHFWCFHLNFSAQVLSFKDEKYFEMFEFSRQNIGL